jgi:hypothetical protein
MFATIIATVSTVAALQAAVVSDGALRSADRRDPTTAVTAERRPPRDTRSADDHLQLAQRAMNNGDFDIARREYSAAAMMDREAGKLPVESSIGLANALYAQAYNREAALTMERLANEASLRGDTDTEAVALADAVWLNVDADQRATARKLSDRLRILMKETPLSVEARKAVKARVG